MPQTYALKPRAGKDLLDILRYIALDNPAAAERMRARFMEAFALLSAHPGIGQERQDLTTKPVRFWPAHPNYVIIYDARPRPIQIVRIYHAARDFDTIMH
jgi:toxin ParE1/3/4